MNPAQRAFVTLWVVAGFGLLAGPPCHGLAASFPGTDYDLQDLIGPQSEAVFEPKSGTIVTTGGSAKLLLPGMPASPPRQLRSVEVEILPAVDVQLHLTWFEGGTQLESPRAIAPADSRQTLVLDLSSMGESDGTVRLRVNGEHGGSVVSRVTLVERTQPNLVLVMVDDLRTVELDLGFGRSLARDSVLKDEIIDRGTTFTEFFNTTPLCCASRTSYLTGQYSHNHGIYGNNYNATGGNGGWRRFWELGHEHNSLGGWMQDAGYRTVLIGKFLNQYPNLPGDFVPETYVPAGWDEWYAEFNNETFVPPEPEFSYSSFRMNENGTVVEYLPPSYLTDVERDHAVDYVNRTAPSGDPFFMYLAPFAPHGPTEPAARHEGAHAAVEPPTPPPSFNEADLSDKPQHIQDGAVQWPNYFGTGGLRKLDMTLAIDELLGENRNPVRTGFRHDR